MKEKLPEDTFGVYLFLAALAPCQTCGKSFSVEVDGTLKYHDIEISCDCKKITINVNNSR